MELKKEFDALIQTLKTDRDEINLKLHLASMDVKNEFESIDQKWDLVAQKAAEFADDTLEVSEEVIEKAKLVGEELKEAYQRIRARLSE